MLTKLIILFTAFSMYLVDSCTIISLFRPEESAHAETCKLFDGLKAFSITESVLGEVVTTLKFKEGLESARRAFQLLMENEAVEILRFHFHEIESASDLFLKHKRLSFVDASLIVLAKSRGLALISQDNALSKAFKSGGKSLLSMR